MAQLSIEAMLETIRTCVALHYPGKLVREVRLLLTEGKIILPMPTLQSLPVAKDEEEVFVPNAFQEAILSALEGKALRTDALGAAAGDRSRLFRNPGGLKELQEQGLVQHHKRLGFYRPDCPPEDLADE
jgi:hypothetical protein